VSLEVDLPDFLAELVVEQRNPALHRAFCVGMPDRVRP
jgi:hypothetical protein